MTTLESVLDPAKLAQDDYDLPGALKKLVRRKERAFQRYVRRIGDDAQAKVLQRELNQLRARTDLLIQLQLVTEREAAKLLNHYGDPTQLDWKLRKKDINRDFDEDDDDEEDSMSASLEAVVVASPKPKARKREDVDEALKDLIGSMREELVQHVVPNRVKKYNAAPNKTEEAEAFAAFFDRMVTFLGNVPRVYDRLPAKHWDAFHKFLQKARTFFANSWNVHEVHMVSLIDAALPLVEHKANHGGAPPAKKAAVKRAEVPVKKAAVAVKKVAAQPVKKAGMQPVRKAKPGDEAVVPTSLEGALRAAGATREKGTCPLGMPPPDRKCVRGFWRKQ